MSPPFLDTAIIKALQRDPGATQAAIRAELGIGAPAFKDAVLRLRYAGKLQWASFKLSPSLQQNTPGACRTARKAPAAASLGAAKRGSASAPPISVSQPSAGPLPTPVDAAKDGAGNARRDVPAMEGAAEPVLGTGEQARPEPTPPGPSISEQVKVEAATKGQRRTAARKISATVHDPLPAEPKESMADRFRRLAREQEEDDLTAAAELDADERRARDLDRLGSPSAVLRRAQRDWPGQCADVASIAKELGIGLGECWRRVIKVGVDCLREGGDEEAVA